MRRIVRIGRRLAVSRSQALTVTPAVARSRDATVAAAVRPTASYRTYFVSMEPTEDARFDEAAPRTDHPMAGSRFEDAAIDSWHFVDRKGSIAVTVDGEKLSFPILNTKAFESLMPTSHRSLVGVKGSFVVGKHGDAERIVLDLSTLTAEPSTIDAPPSTSKKDLRQKTLNVKSYSAMQQEELEKRLKRKQERESGSVTVQGATARVVCPATMKGTVLNWSTAFRTGLIEVDRGEGLTPLHYVVQSVNDFITATPGSVELKGAKVSFRPVHTHLISNLSEVEQVSLARINNEELQRQGLAGVALPKLEVALGDCTNMIAEDIEVVEMPPPPEATGQEDDDGRVDPNDLMLEEEPPHFGVITRWSGGQGTLEHGSGRVFFIDGVASFLSFDPNQAALRGAVVQFMQSKKTPRYAENIVVLSETAAGGGVGDLPAQDFSIHVLRTPMEDDPELVDYSGDIEGSNVPQAIEDLRDPVSAQTREYQEESASRLKDSRALVDDTITVEQKSSTDAKTSVPARATGNISDPYAHLPLRTGTLVTYSANEGTGIIKEESTNARFVIRDATKHVVGFKAKAVQKAFTKGSKVSYVAIGASGRVAVRVRIEETRHGDAIDPEAALDQEEAEEAARVSGEDLGDGAAAHEGADGGGTPPGASKELGDEHDAATASPGATDYWLKRFERVGANMTEYRKITESLTPPEGDDDLDDYMKDDPWFNDPKRNKIVQGNKRVSDQLQVSPSNLINIAMQGRDLEKLKKKTAKVEKQIPDEYRMKARQQAKEIAPKFMQRVKEAKGRGDDVKFDFFD